MGETNPDGMNFARLNPNILMPLPDHNFDPTEAAIPWKVCTSRAIVINVGSALSQPKGGCKWTAGCWANIYP